MLGEPITSKTEANAEADRLRAIIRADETDVNRPRQFDGTLAELFALHFERYVKVHHAEQERDYAYRSDGIFRTFVRISNGMISSF
jgi:hypothetical protein